MGDLCSCAQVHARGAARAEAALTERLRHHNVSCKALSAEKAANALWSFEALRTPQRQGHTYFRNARVTLAPPPHPPPHTRQKYEQKSGKNIDPKNSLCHKRGDTKGDRSLFSVSVTFWQPFCRFFCRLWSLFCLSPFCLPPFAAA